MTIELTTSRLHLVPLGREHGDDLATLYSDHQVARYVGGARLTPETARHQAVRFGEIWASYGFGQSAVIERETGAFVGRVGLHPWPGWDEIELGWVIARDRQRRGYAREAATVWLAWAAETAVADSLTAVIQPANSASIRLAESLGFAYERDDRTPWNDVAVFRRPL